MAIYGVSLLAFSFLAGQMIGEMLGKAIGLDTNVGGVGFAMLMLILLNNWFIKKKYITHTAEEAIQFWNNMYVPIIVAMSATQNVRAAVSGGLLALLVGIIPMMICFLCIPYLSKLVKAPH